jgi:hypothetical protein
MADPGPLSFTFFGVAVELHVPTEQDSTYLAAHFDYYRTDGAERPDIRLWLEGDGDLPFVTALMHEGHRKQVDVDTGTGRVVWESWSGRSQRGTPLPPFALPPLSNRFTVRHASAVSPEPGRAVVVTGASRAGKTSLCLALVERGFAFLSDDTLLVTRESRVMPYLRPINVRDCTLRALPELRGKLAGTARAVWTPTGTTYMVAAHKVPYPIGVESEVACTVRIAHAGGGLRVRRTPGELAIIGDVTRHLAEAADEIEKAYAEVARA